MSLSSSDEAVFVTSKHFYSLPHLIWSWFLSIGKVILIFFYFIFDSLLLLWHVSVTTQTHQSTTSDTSHYNTHCITLPLQPRLSLSRTSSLINVCKQKVPLELLKEFSLFDALRLEYRPPLPFFLSLEQASSLTFVLKPTIEDFEETRYELTLVRSGLSRSQRLIIPRRNPQKLQEVVVWVNCELRCPGTATLIASLYERITFACPTASFYLVGEVSQIDSFKARRLTTSDVSLLWNQALHIYPAPLSALSEIQEDIDIVPSHVIIFQALNPAGHLPIQRKQLPSEWRNGNLKCLYIPIPNYSIHPHKGRRFALGSDSIARLKAGIVGRISNRVATYRCEYHVIVEPLIRDRACATAELILQSRASLVIPTTKTIEEGLRDIVRFVKMRERIEAPYAVIIWSLERMTYMEDIWPSHANFSEYVHKRLYPLALDQLEGMTNSKIYFHSLEEPCRVMPTNFDCYYAQAMGHAAGACLTLCPKQVHNLVLEFGVAGLDPRDPDWRVTVYVPKWHFENPSGPRMLLQSARSHVASYTSSHRTSTSCLAARLYMESSYRHHLQAVGRFWDENIADMNVWYLKHLFRNTGPIQYPPNIIEAPLMLASAVKADCNLTSPPTAIVENLPYNLLLPSSPFSPSNLSPLDFARIRSEVETPAALQSAKMEVAGLAVDPWPRRDTAIRQLLPSQISQTSYPQYLRMECPWAFPQGRASTNHSQEASTSLLRPSKIGFLVAAEICAGMNNIACGLLQRCKRTKSTLVAFRNVRDLMEREEIYFDNYFVDLHLNRPGAGWTQKQEDETILTLLHRGVVRSCAQACADLRLDGLVICSDRDGISGAALLVEECMSRQMNIAIICVPCSSDNDIRHPLIETNLGWDSFTSYVCADMIRQSPGNGSWLFATVGRTSEDGLVSKVSGPSCIEVGLRCHAEFVVIPEIYEAQSSQDLFRRGYSSRLGALVADLGFIMSETLTARDALICLPADVIDRLSGISMAALLSKEDLSHTEYKQWPSEVRRMIASYDLPVSQLAAHILATWVRVLAGPKLVNVQVLVPAVYPELGLPSKLDCELGFAYGIFSYLMIENALSGYILNFHNLTQSATYWNPVAIPLVAIFDGVSSRNKGSDKCDKVTLPALRSPKLDLRGPLLFAYLRHRSLQWRSRRRPHFPGPLQFTDPLADSRPVSLQLQHRVVTKTLPSHRSIFGRLRHNIAISIHKSHKPLKHRSSKLYDLRPEGPYFEQGATTLSDL